MNKSRISFAFIVFLGLLIGCQQTEKNQDVKPTRTGSPRRACGNAILYKFLYPANDYTFNGNGCQTFYIHRGQTRQFTIQMSNTSVTDFYELNINFPNQPSNFQYSVASVSGGSVTSFSPPSGSSVPNGFKWTYDNMPGGTTATLVLNVRGGTSPTAAENGLSLQARNPCVADQDLDCEKDENLHLVLTN